MNVDVFTAGGSSTIASLLPTKTLAFGGDIWPDQPDVPAYLVSFSSWQRAKPRTLLTTLFVFDDLVHGFYTVVAIWTHGYWDFTFSQN